MIPYILYASLILTACLIFYKLLLQQETFFRLNRFVLLACMMLAFVLPVLHVPQQMSFRKAPAELKITQTESNSSQFNIPDPSSTLTRPRTTSVADTQSYINMQQVIHWLIYLYWFGVAIFALNFLMQAIVLLYKAYSRPVIIDGKFRIVEIAGDKAPCSFGNNIFINPEKYDWDTYNQVLLHEKIHIDQKHTLDLLLAEIVLIFQWFNPFAWMWRKELENNLEFFTDNKLLEQEKVEKQSYQVNLLKVAAPHYPLSLTTNYNQSTLKKRLLMMNSKKSNVHTIWKYFFLLPLMVLFVCLFNEPAVQSQDIVKQKKEVNVQANKGMAAEGKWFATIKGDQVKMEFRRNDEENEHNSNNSTFTLIDFKDLPRGKEGTFNLTREAGNIAFTGRFDGDMGMGTYKFTPDQAYNDFMQKEGIDISKGDDAMVFYFINVKRSYVQMLKQQGYADLDKDKVIPMVALDINESYIKSIKDAGFKNIGINNLIPFKALNIDKAYIDEIKSAGYTNVSADKVISMKSQGISGKDIAEYRASVDSRKSDDLKNKAENDEKRSNDYNKEKQQSEDKAKQDDKNMNMNGNIDDDDLIAFKALKIDDNFVNSFKAVGYSHISNEDLIAMKSLGVTANYVKSFTSAGYTNLKTDEIVSLKAQSISPSLIKEYKDLGFKNLSIDDVIGAKATGTSPSFIKAMRDKGHNMQSLEKYIALRTVLGE
ncbi:MAG: M56 family metallopeptidase [Ginsengibacter sp.]